MRILAYTYEADYHCIECTEKRFPYDPEKFGSYGTDNEGNEIHPLFSTDEWTSGEFLDNVLSCSDCFEVIDSFKCDVLLRNDPRHLSVFCDLDKYHDGEHKNYHKYAPATIVWED